MNSKELKALQAPIKDRYRREPQSALVTLNAVAKDAPVGCKPCANHHR